MAPPRHRSRPARPRGRRRPHLGARTSSLEVRAANAGAQALYAALGYETLGRRPRYYSDGEDTLIMRGPLPTITLAAVPNGMVADAQPGCERARGD